MKKNKKVSMAVVRRLPKYYRYLGDLLKKDIKKISSKQLSQLTGFTAPTITALYGLFKPKILPSWLCKSLTLYP